MELYHVLYRGVDGRSIFSDDQDRARFVHDLYEFNDTAPASEFVRRTTHVGHAMSHMGERGRRRIVDVHAWKLMPTHVHLLLSSRVEQGLLLFLQKMRGYARYFNERHERRGRLFDATKKVLIESNAHFLYIAHYIHLNGLDDFPGAQGWRERDKGMIQNADAAFAHLHKDMWSSFRDYCSEKNFPSLLTKTLLESRSGEYEGDLRAFLADRESMDVLDFSTFE